MADWGPLGFEIVPGSIAALGPPPGSLARERRVLEALGGPHAWEGVPGPQSCASRAAGDELVVRLQRSRTRGSGGGPKAVMEPGAISNSRGPQSAKRTLGVCPLLFVFTPP